MRPKTKFRRIRFADYDCARGAQPLNHEAVRSRNKVLQDRRSLRRSNALDRLQVLYGMGKSVKRTDQVAAGKMGIAFARLCQQSFPILKRHDSVYFGIDPLDMIEIGRHD